MGPHKAGIYTDEQLRDLERITIEYLKNTRTARRSW
jgi:hypothetical protein